MTSMRARRPLLALLAGCALGGGCLLPRAARAQCVQNLNVVDCTNVTTGFVAMPGENGLQVTLHPPLFTNTSLLAGEASLDLNDANSVVVLGGTFFSNGPGPANSAAGRAGNANVFVVGDGATPTQVFANGAGSRGLQLGDGNSVTVQFFGGVTSALASGVALEAGASNTITNNGVISSGGTSGFGGTGILLTGGGNSIVNGNTIIVAGGSAPGTAINLQTPAGMTNTVHNMAIGVIDAPFGDMGLATPGIAIRGGDGVENITNDGLIIGNLDLGLGDDVVVTSGQIQGNVLLGGGNDSFSLGTAGNVFGADGGAGTDTLILMGPTRTFAVQMDGFTNFETMQVTGGIWGLAGTGNFPNGVTVSGGEVRPLGIATINGNYLQSAGSGYIVFLTGQNQSDRLDVIGSATIDPGVPMLPVIQGNFDENSVFTVLTATGGVTGAFDLPAARLSAVFVAHEILLPNAIQLAITRLPYATPTASANQRATGAYLDAIRAAGPGSDMQSVLDQFDTLAIGPYQAALDHVHPEAYDAETNRMIWRGRGFADAALARRPACRPVPWPTDPSVVSASPCGASGWTPWLATWGDFNERDGGAGHIDYNDLGGDIALGADRRLGDRWLLTGYLGTGGSTIDVTGTASADVYSAEVGAALGFQQGPLGVSAVGAYGHGWHHTRRDITVGGITRSAYSTHGSDRLTGAVEAGWTFDMAPFFVEPLASVDWTWIQQDRITETGAGSLSLAIDSRSDSVLSTTAGLRAGTTFFKHGYSVNWLEWADGVWRPEVSLRWREIWAGRERDLTSRFTGAPAAAGTFTVSGNDAQSGAEAGLRVMFQPESTDVQVGLAYDGFYGDGTFNHFVGVQVRIPIP